jgi:hypothetical protein
MFRLSIYNYCYILNKYNPYTQHGFNSTYIQSGNRILQHKKKKKKRRKHKKATVSILRSTDILGHNMFYGPMYSSCFNETEYV